MRLSGIAQAVTLAAGIFVAAAVPAAAHPGFGGMHGAMHGFHGFGGMHGGFHSLGGMHGMHANWGGHMGGWGHRGWGHGGWGHGGWGQHNWNRNWNKNVNRNININRNFNRNVNVNRNLAHWRFHHGFRGFHRWRDGFGRWHWAASAEAFALPFADYGYGGGGYAEDNYGGDEPGYDTPYADDYDSEDAAYAGNGEDYGRDRDDNCPCACDRDNMYGDGEDGCGG